MTLFPTEERLFGAGMGEVLGIKLDTQRESLAEDWTITLAIRSSMRRDEMTMWSVCYTHADRTAAMAEFSRIADVATYANPETVRVHMRRARTRLLAQRIETYARRIGAA